MNSILNKECIYSYGVGIGIAFSVWIFLTIAGYPLIEINSGIVSFNSLQIYMLPLFFAYGILIGGFIYNVIFKQINDQQIILLFELLIITFLSFLRISINIPVSGHALIISFYLLFLIVEQKSLDYLKILIGFLVFILTIYAKLIINDLFTLFSGITMGFLIFLIGYFLKKNNNDSENEIHLI